MVMKIFKCWWINMRPNTLFLFFWLIPTMILAQPQDSVKVKKQSINQKRIERKKLMNEVSLLKDAITQCEKTIAGYTDEEFIPTTMFQLSQLYVRWGKLTYQLSMEKFDRQLALFDKGILKEEPEEPRINYEASIKLCEELLEKYVDEIDFKEHLLYWYGICLFDDNNREMASTIFKQLLFEFPETNYCDEVNFRIGEYFFDVQEYDSALAVYSKTIEKWDNPFFGMALYKLAWSHYKKNNYEKSISHFFYLLGDLDMLDSLNCEEMGRSKLDLRDETIDYLAISFSEIGGLSVANSFLGDVKSSKEQIIPITHRLGDVYRKRSYYDDALNIYNDLIEKHPMYDGIPEVYFGLFDCYNKLENDEKASEARRELIKSCHPKSKWAKVNRKKEDREKVKELVSQIDFILATPLLAKADQTLVQENKAEAINFYKEFVQNFSRDERAPRAAFNMAECYYDLNDFENAARIYLVVVKKFPPNELTEDAAYNRVICFDQLYAAETDSTPDELKISLGKKNVKIPTKSKGQKDLLVACNEFVNVIPSGDKTVEILLKSIQEFFNLEQFEMAENLLNRVIFEIRKKQHGLNYYSQAASLMAQICYKNERFKEAEKWYSIVASTASDSADLRDKSRKMMASSRYKVAENLMATGDSLKAAREFERIAMRYAGSDVAEVATYDAALQFEKAGQDAKAAKLFELFGTRYPKSEYVVEAMFRAGVLYERLGLYSKAARNFMSVYQRDKNANEAPDALFSAGIAYEAAEKWSLAAAAFGRFYQEYKADPVKVFEAVFREAHTTYKSRNYVVAQRMLINTLNYYNTLKSKGVEIDDYFAAQSTFLLAEIDYVYFSSVKLTPPLQHNMAKKQAVLNALLQKYLETTKFKIADWTTAAFYKIGQAFENFGQSVMDSPAPEGATEEQLTAYWDTIHSQLVVPLLNQAMGYYESNERLANEAQIENEWIEKTRERISALQEEIAAVPNKVANEVAN